MKRYLLASFCIGGWSLAVAKSYNCVLGLAASQGDLSKVRSAIKHSANVDYQNAALWGQTALMNACAETRRKVVAFLLKKKANPNLTDEDQKSALMYAAIAHNQEKAVTIISHLLKAGAQIDATDVRKKTALMYALQVYNLVVAQALLQAGANRALFDSSKKTALGYFQAIPKEIAQKQPELYKKVLELLLN